MLNEVFLFPSAEGKKPNPEEWTEVKRRKPSSSKAETKVSMFTLYEENQL